MRTVAHRLGEVIRVQMPAACVVATLALEPTVARQTRTVHLVATVTTMLHAVAAITRRHAVATPRRLGDGVGGAHELARGARERAISLVAAVRTISRAIAAVRLGNAGSRMEDHFVAGDAAELVGRANRARAVSFVAAVSTIARAVAAIAFRHADAPGQVHARARNATEPSPRTGRAVLFVGSVGAVENAVALLRFFHAGTMRGIPTSVAGRTLHLVGWAVAGRAVHFVRAVQAVLVSVAPITAPYARTAIETIDARRTAKLVRAAVQRLVALGFVAAVRAITHAVANTLVRHAGRLRGRVQPALALVLSAWARRLAADLVQAVGAVVSAVAAFRRGDATRRRGGDGAVGGAVKLLRGADGQIRAVQLVGRVQTVVDAVAFPSQRDAVGQAGNQRTVAA